MACRDRRTRTITITTDAPNNLTKAITVTACTVDMSGDANVFDALRPLSGKITIQCVDGVEPADFLPSRSRSHSVTITRPDDNDEEELVFDFYGYIDCDTRTQDFPSEGNLFDISLISPLGIAQGTRLEDNKQTYELENIQQLIISSYRKAGGSAGGFLVLPKLWDNCFEEKIAHYNCVNINDSIEFLDGEYKENYYEARTVGDMLQNIANFYGVTFMEIGMNLYAIAPDCTEYKQKFMGGGIWEDFPDSDLIQNVAQLTYGSQDIASAPNKIEVATRIDGITDVVEMGTDKFSLMYKEESMWAYSKFHFSAASYPDKDTLQAPGGYASTFETSSKDNLLNVCSDNGWTVPSSPGFLAPTCFLNIDGENSGPSGMCIVSNGTGEIDTETGGGVLENLMYYFARLRSKSVVVSHYDKLKIKFNVAAIARGDYYSPTHYWWYLNAYGKPKNDWAGQIRVRVKIGSWDSGWQQPIGNNRELDKIAASEIEMTFTIDSFEKYGPLEILIEGNNQTSYTIAHPRQASQIFIWGLSASLYTADADSKVREFADFSEYKWTHRTNFYGEEFTHELPFSPLHPGIIGGAWNAILGNDGKPFYKIAGKIYEQWMLERLAKQLDHLQIKLELPTVLYVRGIATPFITHDGKLYLLTGYSLDYMTGIDKLQLTSITL